MSSPGVMYGQSWKALYHQVCFVCITMDFQKKKKQLCPLSTQT
jgi:hypothetical protein